MALITLITAQGIDCSQVQAKTGRRVEQGAQCWLERSEGPRRRAQGEVLGPGNVAGPEAGVTKDSFAIGAQELKNAVGEGGSLVSRRSPMRCSPQFRRAPDLFAHLWGCWMKTCPECCSEIPEQAEVCQACGRRIVGKQRPECAELSRRRLGNVSIAGARFSLTV